MTDWHYFNPVHLRFGEGVFDRIGTVVNGRSYLLVTHPDAPLQRWRDRLIELAGAPLAIVDDIEPNPSLDLLARICDRLPSKGGIDVVVALGGGSVIDAAKFLAAGHGHFAPVQSYLDGDATLPMLSLPIIAIPTTAGTGSDLTKWATIWDPRGGRKLSLNKQDLYAETSLVDPLITESLPWSMTRASGLDALSHALESIWNINANPVTRTFALEAARNLMQALPILRDDFGNSAARRKVALGASQAGLAFSNTQTALAHNISYPLTLDHGVVHGIACSFCLPEVMTAAIGVSGDADAALTAIFGDLATAPRTLRRFLLELDVPATTPELGAGSEEWSRIVDDAFAGPRGRNFIGSRANFPVEFVAA